MSEFDVSLQEIVPATPGALERLDQAFAAALEAAATTLQNADS